MPGFLQTAFLAGLIALAAPVLIHLFFRMKTKRVELGTIRFIRLVLEENARRRKVMQWLLLALRLAVVALLAMLFARPFLTAATTGSDTTLLVLLIDQSASMQLRGENGPLIDQAVAEARQLLERAGPRTRCEIAFFDDRVHPLTGNDKTGQPTVTAAMERLKAPDAMFGATNYGRAFAWARDICLNVPAGVKELHLFTDLQRSGLDWTEVEPMPAEVVAHLHDLGRAAVNNLAVSEVRTPRLWVRPGEAPAIRAAISHGGSFPLEEVPIVMEIGRIVGGNPKAGSSGTAAEPAPLRTAFSKLADRFIQRERVKLEPGTTVTLDFDLPSLGEGLWQARVTVEYDDDLGFDNQRFLAISATPAYRILILDGGSAETSLEKETYYLDAALRLAPEGDAYAASPFLPTTVDSSTEAGLLDFSGYDAVCLANVGNLPKSTAARLAEFVDSGGGLLVFTGDKVSAKSCEALTQAGLGVGEIGDMQVAVDLPWRFQDWNETHPIFLPLNDPQHGDLRRLIFAAYSKIVPTDESAVLARFNSGDAAVLERRVGQGTVLWVTTSSGREWSDWAVSRLFLPLVHQMLGYEVGLTAGGRVRSRLVDGPLPEENGESTELVSNSEEPPLVPGVDHHPRYAEVINASPRESEMERCTPQEFEERFALKFAETEGPPTGPAAGVGNVEFQRDELWQWVACLLLGVLLLEGFVGNRTTA